MTIEELERIHEAFWREEAEKLVRRMADPDLWDAAAATMHEEVLRVPVRSRRSLEALLLEAERDRKRWLGRMGRDGRRARRPDALQQLILEVVKRKPLITECELLNHLSEDSRISPLVDIDEEAITFDGNGAIKTAPLSGLKDRLSRAKRALKSRSR